LEAFIEIHRISLEHFDGKYARRLVNIVKKGKLMALKSKEWFYIAMFAARG